MNNISDFFNRYRKAESLRVIGVDHDMASWLADNGYKSDTAGKNTNIPKSWYKIMASVDDTRYIATVASHSASMWGSDGAPYVAKLWEVDSRADTNRMVQEFDIPKFNKQLMDEIENHFTSLAEEKQRGTESMADFNF